jgi:hypothetical protein
MNRIAKNTLFVAMILTGMVIALPSIVPVAAKPAASTYHIDLWYDNSGHYSSQEAAFTLLVKLQLEKTGYFDVTLHTTDWSTYGGQIGTMPTFMLGWFYDYFDESNYIIPFVRLIMDWEQIIPMQQWMDTLIQCSKLLILLFVLMLSKMLKYKWSMIQWLFH